MSKKEFVKIDDVYHSEKDVDSLISREGVVDLLSQIKNQEKILEKLILLRKSVTTSNLPGVLALGIVWNLTGFWALHTEYTENYLQISLAFIGMGVATMLYSIFSIINLKK